MCKKIPERASAGRSEGVIVWTPAEPANAAASTVARLPRVDGVVSTLFASLGRSWQLAAVRTALVQVECAVIGEKRGLVLPPFALPAVEAGVHALAHIQQVSENANVKLSANRQSRDDG